MSIQTSLRLAVAVIAMAGFGVSGALADPPAKAAPPKNDPRARIAAKLDVPVDAIHPSVVPGLYEVAHGSEVLYMTGDGKYVIAGDLYDAEKGKNLTAQRRNEGRLAGLKTVSDEEAIIYSPKTPKYTITVFTDVDCQFCRRLHGDIAEYNKLGVRVRYVFFPRSGPGTDSWRKAEAVWCSANRKDALTKAKQGTDPGNKICKDNPVAKTYALGQDLGIRGTPGIFTDRGEYLPGYYQPAQLVEKLKGLENGTADDEG